jgi:hypothetical protein
MYKIASLNLLYLGITRKEIFYRFVRLDLSKKSLFFIAPYYEFELKIL